jgi:hypothetical protein
VATARYYGNNNPKELSTAGLAANGNELLHTIARDTDNPRVGDHLRSIAGNEEQRKMFIEGTTESKLSRVGMTADMVDGLEAKRYTVGKQQNIERLGSKGSQRQARIGQVKQMDPSFLSRIAAQASSQAIRARDPQQSAEAAWLMQDLYSQIDPSFISEIVSEHGGTNTSSERKEELRHVAERIVESVNVGSNKGLHTGANKKIAADLKAELKKALKQMS